MVITAFDAMNDALEQCSDLGFEMSPGFATHWAMGSETLTKLGHPEVVHEWAGIYRTKRHHFPRPSPLTPIDGAEPASWEAALGDFDHRAGDWQVLFEHELADGPWQEVLVRWWPRLIPGVAAGLTHGLIRTMHAVRSIEASNGTPTTLQIRELATGLAYWAAHHVQQPGQAALLGEGRLPAILASIPRLDPDQKIGLRDKGLFLHMPDIAGWGQAVSQLASPDDIQSALSDMIVTFVQVNLAHPDQLAIPLIHTVTAPAALRVMLPHLPEELHLLSFIAVWRANAALLATFAPQRAAELADVAPDGGEPTVSERELAERAVEHGDEHALKYTEACLREYRLRPDPRLLLSPEQMLGKLPRYFRRAERKAARA
jgi:hypothetical protein